MNASEFHNLTPKPGATNFQNCHNHWKAAMQASGLWDDPAEQANYLLAACYPLVCRNKSLQRMYRDAFLGPSQVTNESVALSEEERQRIQQVVAARDRFQLQQELDRVLGRFEPPAKLLPALQKALCQWVGHGLRLMRHHGQEGLNEFLNEVSTWLNRFRKKGGHPRLRLFIDMFAYEAKVSFYTCFANAWVDLVAWLKEHRDLDQLSERFLRLWHNQNQPVEIPHGRTMGGLYYPTHVQATAVQLTDKSVPVRQTVMWQTPRIGPQFIPDVFAGQILSLHPLSGFFMKDPALCAIAGRFLTSPSFDEVMRRGRSQNHPLYWDLVGAIVTAACYYRKALDCQRQNRGVRLRGGDAAESIACWSDQGESSAASLLEDFAVNQDIRCPHCAGGVSLETWSPAPEGSDHFDVRYCCRDCQCTVPTVIQRPMIEKWLLCGV
jgi:hypothetical protein